jgi:hypothetical protein
MRIKKSFRENVSEIFSLKSKKKTLLFGTFVPGFWAHAFAYTHELEIASPKETLHKGSYVLSLISVLPYSLSSYIFLVPTASQGIRGLEGNWEFKIISILIASLFNFIFTLLIMGVLKNKRKELDRNVN